MVAKNRRGANFEEIESIQATRGASAMRLIFRWKEWFRFSTVSPSPAHDQLTDGAGHLIAELSPRKTAPHRAAILAHWSCSSTPSDWPLAWLGSPAIPTPTTVLDIGNSDPITIPLRTASDRQGREATSHPGPGRVPGPERGRDFGHHRDEGRPAADGGPGHLEVRERSQQLVE